MPCYDERNTYEYGRNEAKAEIDRLTDLLCKAGRAYLNEVQAPMEVLEWWCEHERIDAHRGEPWK